MQKDKNKSLPLGGKVSPKVTDEGITYPFINDSKSVVHHRL